MNAITPLGDICRPKQWRTLSKAEMIETGFPVYGANGRIGFADEYTHEKPTILVGCRGSCGTVTITEPKSYANGNAMALDELDEARTDIRYLYRYLSFRGFADVTTGTSQPQIIGQNLRRVEVPLPSLDEQRRIAAILDRADALRAKRREAIARLDQLTQSVFLDMFGDPATNPKGWPMAALGRLGDWRSGGTPSRSNSAYFNGDIPWYSSGELNDVYVSASEEGISEVALRESSAKLMRPGTLMVGMYDTAAFKSSITTVPSACNQAVAFSFLDEEAAEVLYVYQALQTGKDHFRRLQRGVRQKNLNLSMIRSTELPLPPRSMQARFAEVFRAIRAKIIGQEDFMKASDRLFASVQARSFSKGD